MIRLRFFANKGYPLGARLAQALYGCQRAVAALIRDATKTLRELLADDESLA